MKGASLFSSAGIGENFLSSIGIDIIVSNEIIEKRAGLYRSIYPETNVVSGDFTDKTIFSKVIELAAGKIDFLIASPPCQGMSVAGKNRCENTMLMDERNYLIMHTIKAINHLKPTFILIENVPALLKLKLIYKGELKSIQDILFLELGDKYNIESEIVDAADYGVPQTRNRAIIKIYEKGKVWLWPTKTNKVTVREAIGFLPSIEAGEESDIKWHFARKHDPRHILWMKHTATGQSAFSNEVYFPQKLDGTRIKGYESSYRRIKWDEPAPTITIRNDAISSQRNVHPGRRLNDGTYSDARVLTPLELMILNSLPSNWNIPENTPEILIRQCIGESIPPLMIKKIVGELL
ncbi:DNA (cytosine-5-)-methyltransferase [uncultured Clostridium sp.]|uniref:DNA (cytosine-5-)-methyltransferase n=1 Tax=uncultured Clostridium sp. TaxID=59620 RepID=UPI0028E74560|nr:DNA (cytosine-5-)-methyltransferase [uncultured Clostridium sp.]